MVKYHPEGHHMPVGISITVDPRSVAAVKAALEGVKQGVQNRVVKAALAKQARKSARVVKDTAPRSTGAYEAAIAADILAGIEREAAKYARRGKSSYG